MGQLRDELKSLSADIEMFEAEVGRVAEKMEGLQVRGKRRRS